MVQANGKTDGRGSVSKQRKNQKKLSFLLNKSEKSVKIELE